MGKMFLETVRSEELAHLSYVVGHGGKAAVIDPRRDSREYMDIAYRYPAHGAGSVCGAGMADREFSTLGYERKRNPVLRNQNKDDFIRHKINERHYMPPYFKKMELFNQEALLFCISTKSTNMKRDDCPVQSIFFWGNFRRAWTRFLRIGLSQLFAAAASGPSSPHRF